jgi:membrane associated rhomboid family serine protease
MFFVLPVGVDYRARRYPVVTFTLMGICVAVYLITLILGVSKWPEVFEWVLANLWLIPAESHWWTYVTSLFVHEGFLHLAGNMVYLFLFGACVEDVIGRPRFIAFYLFCGFVAELMHVAISPGHFASEIPLGGASGAISGCIGAFLLLFLRTKIEFKWVFFFWFRFWNGEFFLPAWVVISFWFLSDLAMMVLTLGAREQGGGVAFGAHVGGTLCGLALMSLQKLFPHTLAGDESEETEEPVETAATRAQLAPALVAAMPPTYLFIGGAQAGPFTSVQIQQMFMHGSIPSDALYWQEGMADWQNVERLCRPGMG